MTIKVSQQQKDKTKVFEGFTTTPKKDTDGNYVIGYGVQVDPKVVGKISPDGAEKMFNDRYASAEAELSPLINRPLTQNQQDALGDTHFNMGLTKMLKHGIIDLVNSGKDQEVAALFKRLNAAKIAETGKTEAIGNLPERANYRADLWLKPDDATAPPSPQAQAQVAAPATQRSSLLDEVEQYNTPEEAASTKQDLLGEVEQYAVSAAPSPQAQFERATDISDPKQLDTQKKVQMLSKQFQTPADVVEGMLMTEPEETVRTRLSSPGMAQNYPHTTEWASDPTNNALLKMTSDYPKKIEKATVKFNEQKPNWQKAIDSQFDRFEDSAVLAQMVFGSANRQQGIQQLRQLDERRKMNVLTSPEIEEVKNSIQKLRQAFGAGWDQIAKINFGKDSTDNIVDLMKAAYGAGKITAEEAAAFMYTAATNPKAYGEFMVESSGAPIAAGIAGSIAGSPLTGAAATYTTSSVMAFGGKIREELEKFRSPKTNDIDYEAFFSDPARIARLRAEAVTYGLSIGAIETAFQFLGGKFLSKAIPKNPVLATGAALIGGTAEEFAGEAGARTLGQVVSGNPVTLKENALEGVEETVGGPLSAAGAMLQGGVNYINSRKGTIKTSETLKESSKANEDVNDLSGLKETIKTNPAGKEHSENFEDLVTKAAEGGIKEPFDDETVITPEPTKEQIDAALKYGRDQAKTGTVSFTPSEWEAFNAARGMDPHEALGVFSPKTQAAYANNRESDTSIVIPVSEWAFATEEDPDIDQIVRINGNKYNNIEANELIDAFEKDPLVFFDTDATADSAEDVLKDKVGLFAYHGSPFKFDKFKETAIGRGEGAQAFGYGLYFSTDKDVAEWYRENLATSTQPIPPALGRVFAENQYFGFNSRYQAVKAFQAHPDWKDRWDAHSLPPEDLKLIDDYLAELEVKGKGQVYKVALPKGLWVDLDSTLSEVPPEITTSVREALLSAGVSPDDTQGTSEDWGNVDTSIPKFDVLKAFLRGEPLNNDYVSFGQLLSSLSHSEDKALAVQLAARGFHGFTYTGSESGKRNFVVLSEDDAKIVKTYYDQLGQEGETVEEPHGEVVDSEGSTPMRPLNLTSEFSSQEEQEAFEGFRRRLNRALPSTIQPELADDISRILLRRFKLRAAIANLPLSEAFNRLQFGRRISQGRSRAQMPTLEKDFFTVAFNKNDKASSVFHELAHVWLHEMAEDYQLLKDIDLNTAHGDVKAYREAMETARELFGIDSLDEILAPESEAKLTRIHETFAQTAEDYFMEGKSQNSRIQRLMDRMREWLAKHIDVLRKLSRKYPTVEINPKTEFMFDAILAATKASEDQVYAMFPDPAFTTEELGAGAAQYMSTFYDARSAAKAFLYGKAFKKKGLRENERIFETEYNRISKEAEDYVDSLPSMNLRNQMFAAYHENKRKGLKGEETRISYESAQEHLTDGTDAGIAELKKNVPYFMLTGKKKGGISVPDLMSILGINSTEELRDMLIEANRREEMVQAVIDDMLKHETAPLLKSEDEMHQLAEEAVNGEGREKILKEEFKIFMEKHPNQFVRATSGLITSADSLPKTVKDLYKQESSLQIGATPAHKFSALAYLNDMNRFRKESAKAYKARDFELAVDKKVKEAKAFYLYKEAVRAEKEIAKARKQISNLSKVIKNKVLFQNTYDYEVVALAAKTVAQVKNGIPVEPFTREQLAPGSSLSDTDIDVINDRLSRLVGEPGGDNLTVNGSVALGEMAKSLLKISRDHKELLVEDEVKNLDVAVAEDLSKMNGNIVPFKRTNQDKTSMLAAAKTSNTKMRGALDQMYKSTEEWATSHLGRLFSWLGSAEAQSDIEKRELRKRLRQAMNKFPISPDEISIRRKREERKEGEGSKVKDAYDTTKVFVKGKIVASDRFEWMPFIDNTASPIFWDSAKFKFDNMGQFITAMLYMGSESGAKKFLYGKGLANKANINNVVTDFWNMVTDKYNKNLISKGHLEFVGEVWKMLDAIHPRLAQVLYETQGFPMGKIEGWEVKTPIGTLKGGYYPVVHSKQISIEDMTKLLDGGSNLTDWVKAFPGKDTKMALDRTEFYGDVNMNLNALNAYIEAAMNTIHLRKPLLSISKFVNHPAFANTLETRRPGLYDNMLKPWMERVKLQTYVDPKSIINGINPILRRLRQSTGISFFFLNKASIFRQTLGTLQAVPEIGPLHMSLGAANFALSPLTTFRRAMELSPVMKDRMISSQTKFLSVVEDLNRANDLISKGNEAVEKVTYLPLQAAQTITDLIVWNAAYNKMIAREMSIQDAVSYADNVVKKTQGSSNISEMPNIQYGSEASKWFTQFSTVPLINYELVTDAYRRGEKNTVAANFAMSVALTIAVLAPVAIDVLVSQGLFGDDDDKDKKDKDSIGELILKRGTGAALESFAPVVGKYAGSAIAYGEPSFSPSARKIDDNTAKALKALTAASKYSVDLTANEKAAISEFLTIILGTATGVTVPYNVVGKMEVDNYKNLSDNEKRNLKMKRTIQRRRAKMSLGE